MNLGNWLHPDSLPDASSSSVQSTMARKASCLFPSRLREIIIIPGPQNNFNLSISCQIAQIHFARKRCESPTMSSYFLTIDPNSRLIIHSLKVDQDLVCLPFCWNLDTLPIPDTDQVILVLNPGQFGFRAKGNLNCLGQ